MGACCAQKFKQQNERFAAAVAALKEQESLVAVSVACPPVSLCFIVFLHMASNKSVREKRLAQPRVWHTGNAIALPKQGRAPCSKPGF
jgi:hypothetical protein